MASAGNFCFVRTCTTLSINSKGSLGSSCCGWYPLNNALSCREFNFKHVELSCAKSFALYLGAWNNYYHYYLNSFQNQDARATSHRRKILPLTNKPLLLIVLNDNLQPILIPDVRPTFPIAKLFLWVGFPMHDCSNWCPIFKKINRIFKLDFFFFFAITKSTTTMSYLRLRGRSDNFVKRHHFNEMKQLRK